ncbi:MAG: PleD family two-component system response regulator [Merismopedia sp. SIO2A8]|nr:PleD family two-component system response regulator [Merismopedia sp. SIO2A8]
MFILAESFRILVVEDDRLSRRILCRFLKRQGYQVIEACNGEEGLTSYAAMQPDLVLLDAMMPNMNGFECCSRLLKLPGAENTPIIMVTGLEDEASVDWAFDAGATDYVTKPIHWPILRRRVKNMLEKTYLYQELERVNQKLKEHVITDALTGLANRRHFDECLDREWKRSLRDESTLALILCDIDYFKAYNDTYGHQAGDLCLQQVAQALKTKAAKRATDIVARYGGEEFAAILPGTGLDGALEVADRLKNGVRELGIPHQGARGSHDHITISVGVASTVAERDILPSDLLNCADKALYHAKENGRNAWFLSLSCMSCDTQASGPRR